MTDMFGGPATDKGFGRFGGLGIGLATGGLGALMMRNKGRTGNSSSGIPDKQGNIIPKGYEQGRIAQYGPEQMEAFKRQFGNIGPDSYLSRLAGGDQSLYNEMEAPALQQFGAIQANTAGRFSGQGMGSRRSSGFQHAQNQASSDFAQQLQSNRMDLRRQAMQDLHSMTNELLGQRPYDNYLIKKQSSNKFGDIMSGVLPIAGMAVGNAFGGHAGGMVGSMVGTAAGQAFQR